jgi:hypothetical protein
MALMMVLLIGNPFCCCAFSHDSTAADSSLPACCRAKLAEAAADSPKTPVPGGEIPLTCPCLKEPGIVAAGELLLPVAQVSTPAPPLYFHGMAMRPAARKPSWGQLPHSGRYGPEATAPPFRLLYGVFRC